MPVDAPHEGFEPAGPLAELPAGEQAELLYEETEQLKEALERRPIIDVARGVLMASWSYRSGASCDGTCLMDRPYPPGPRYGAAHMVHR